MQWVNTRQGFVGISICASVVWLCFALSSSINHAREACALVQSIILWPSLPPRTTRDPWCHSNYKDSSCLQRTSLGTASAQGYGRHPDCLRKHTPVLEAKKRRHTRQQHMLNAHSTCQLSAALWRCRSQGKLRYIVQEIKACPSQGESCEKISNLAIIFVLKTNI